MLNRFYIIAKAGYPASISHILNEEHFDYQYGKLDTPTCGYDVVVVSCVDFHDVGVVLDKLGTHIGLTTFFVDANNNIFQYNKQDRTIDSLGYVYPGKIDSYNHTLTIGSKSYSFFFGGSNVKG